MNAAALEGVSVIRRFYRASPTAHTTQVREHTEDQCLSAPVHQTPRLPVPPWFRFVSAGALACLLAASTPALAQLPERPPLGSTLTVDTLGILPAPGNLFSLLDTAVPDVIADRIDTGGLSAGDAARVGAHGSTWTQTFFKIGDIDVTDPRGTGAPLLLPGVDTWERVDVVTGLMRLDETAPGLAVTLTPRSPLSNWATSGLLVVSPPAFNAAGDVGSHPSIARLNSWLQGNVLAGGPIVPAKLGLFATVDATRSTHFVRAGPEIIDSNVASAFVNLTATPKATDQIRLIGWLQRARDPIQNHAALGRPNTGEQRLGFHGQGAWTHELADKDGGLRISAGYTTRNRSNSLTPPAFVVVERLRDGPIPDLLDAGPGLDRTWSVSAQIHGGFATESGPGTRVAIVAGLDVAGASTTAQSSFAGVVGELLDGIPARLWQFTDPPDISRWRSRTISGYAGITGFAAPRVTVNGGLRIEATRGFQSDNEVVKWNRALGRAGAHWLISERAWNLAAFGQYGRYGHRLPLRDLASGDPTAPTATVWRWTAPVGTTTLQPSGIGPMFQRMGPGSGGDPTFSAIDPDLKQPYLHEIITGFESRPHPSTFVRLVAIGRREHHLLGVVDTGVPESTYTTVGVPDPGVDLVGTQDDFTLQFYNRSPATFGADRYLLTNPLDHDTSFVGADLTIQTRIRRWLAMAGITAGRSEALSANRGFGPLENDAGLLGEVFIDPNARDHAQGRVFTERGYTIKLAQAFHFNRDVDLGLVARYQDGQHFARLVILEDLNQGAEAVRAFRNGRTRFTFSMTVDARVQKTFRVNNRRINAILDAYNVFNQSLEVEEFQVSGAMSRLTTAVQPPRVIQLGIRIPF
jgi:hypothetical protein